MSAVADSSPLVILTKLGCLDFLNRVFQRVCISNEVHYEVVIAVAGLPGASEVSKAGWIEVKSVQNSASLLSAQRKYGLGPGELSTILLAKAEGLEIFGSVGLLETFYLRRYLIDLRSAFCNSWSTTFISIRDCWIVVCDPWAFLRFKLPHR